MGPDFFHSDKSQAFTASCTASFPLRIAGSGHVARSQAKEFKAALRSFESSSALPSENPTQPADIFSFERIAVAREM